MSKDTRPDAAAAPRMMGSLRDALAAATPSTPALSSVPPPLPSAHELTDGRSAAEAVREARGGSAPMPMELEVPQTKVARLAVGAQGLGSRADAVRTQLVRGKQGIKKTDFFQDPVVGWLVVVGGAGLGAFRPIYEGNNTIGRGKGQRIPIDFGDETISSEEQAYIRYDSVDRRFLLVPNLAKTNIVAVNDRKPTGAVELSPMDLITMGRTQLVFVPFCGGEFDWAELTEAKG